MLGGAALPGPTRLVVGISNFLKDNIFISLGLRGCTCFFGVKFLLRTKLGSKGFNWCAINAPKLGDLVSKVNIARITRTFGTLLSSGVPILQALTITQGYYWQCLLLECDDSYSRFCA